MGAPPAAAARKPCCVCDAPGGKHCTKCKSREYCSKKCQLVDWHEGEHKAQCRQMAAAFQDRRLDELMPLKLKIKEEPAIVADVAPADGFKAAARLPAVPTAKAGEAGALNDSTEWRGTCAVCLDLLPIDAPRLVFYECCCEKICKDCSDKCHQYDERCPLCRAPASASDAEMLRRLQKHADEGNANARVQLGDVYRDGQGLQKSSKRAFEFYQLAAAQGHAMAQTRLAMCYESGEGAEIDLDLAATWHRRAADQGYPDAQSHLGAMYYDGAGVAQSYDEALKWLGLAAAQGHAGAEGNVERVQAWHAADEDVARSRVVSRRGLFSFAKTRALWVVRGEPRERERALRQHCETLLAVNAALAEDNATRAANEEMQPGLIEADPALAAFARRNADLKLLASQLLAEQAVNSSRLNAECERNRDTNAALAAEKEAHIAAEAALAIEKARTEAAEQQLDALVAKNAALEERCTVAEETSGLALAEVEKQRAIVAQIMDLNL
jgi:hypothetical protein